MEITCEQCGTVFSVDPDAVSVGTREVVCPGCFQFHALPGPEGPPSTNDAGGSVETPVPHLGAGGIADRLRDGFTLAFEVRHPAWDTIRKLNPYEIQQCIHGGEFDGQEEYREKAGRWFRIGDNPDFALTFQLVGITLESTRDEQVDPAHRKFVGWKSAAVAPAAPAEVSPEPAEKEGEESARVVVPESRKWALLAGAGLAIAVVAAVLAALL